MPVPALLLTLPVIVPGVAVSVKLVVVVAPAVTVLLWVALV
jgi:hypothetical protein